MGLLHLSFLPAEDFSIRRGSRSNRLEVPKVGREECLTCRFSLFLAGTPPENNSLQVCTFPACLGFYQVPPIPSANGLKRSRQDRRSGHYHAHTVTATLLPVFMKLIMVQHAISLLLHVQWLWIVLMYYPAVTCI